MSGNVITVALLTIASVVAATIMINSVYPSIGDMAGAFSSSARVTSERIQTDIKIINEVNNSDLVYVWVKNTGTKKIDLSLVEKTDVFFGKVNSFQFIPYNSSTQPGWNYTVANGDGDDYWDTYETIKLTINYSTLSSGEYYINIVTYNGETASDYFSV